MMTSAKLRRLAAVIEADGSLREAERLVIANVLRWHATLVENSAQVRLDWNEVREAAK
jgi:hypothetical protein